MATGGSKNSQECPPQFEVPQPAPEIGRIEVPSGVLAVGVMGFLGEPPGMIVIDVGPPAVGGAPPVSSGGPPRLGDPPGGLTIGVPLGVGDEMLLGPEVLWGAVVLGELEGEVLAIGRPPAGAPLGGSMNALGGKTGLGNGAPLLLPLRGGPLLPVV